MAGNPGQKRSVLIFHGIGTPRRVLEPGEAAFWISRAVFCEILDRTAAMGAAAPEITFDDGNASDVEIALPELEKRGLRAMHFLLSARIGQPGSLSEADVGRLAAAGHVIGLHGAIHRDWRRLNAAGKQVEWRDARHVLADLAGAPVTLAAAPFGRYDRGVTAALAEEGFAALYTSDRGQVRDTHFLRPRNCIMAGMTEHALANALTGHVPLAQRLMRVPGRMRKRLLPARRTT